MGIVSDGRCGQVLSRNMLCRGALYQGPQDRKGVLTETEKREKILDELSQYQISNTFEDHLVNRIRLVIIDYSDLESVCKVNNWTFFYIENIFER